jgi:hypothetical protein
VCDILYEVCLCMIMIYSYLSMYLCVCVSAVRPDLREGVEGE